MSFKLVARFIALVLALSLVAPVARAQEEPALPPGLAPSEEQEEPALPPGLGPTDDEEEPALPPGLGEEPTEPGEAEATERALTRGLPFDVTGFWDTRVGVRTQHDPYEDDMSLGETRLQLEMEKSWTTSSLKVTTDLLYDWAYDHHGIDLEEGEGWLDLREASYAFTPTDFMDVKAGRQILTWGTGDMLFINDLFPKDWNSFFLGRDEEYLKAPSDAVKISLYSDPVNLDVVYTPRFDADRFIDGERVSYWNTSLGRRAGEDAPVHADERDDWFDEDEIALRLFRNVAGYETAVYGYRGYWKSPGGMDPFTGRAIFPDLSIYGASVRGTVGKGIGNLEVGYYDSEDDGSGADSFVRNSEFRFLVGYEQELARDFTAALQHYLELMMDYGDYRRSLPPGVRSADENRHVLTLRLTKLLMSQNLKLSLFTYYSPTDRDAYLRPNVHYKIDDHWAAEVGGNVFVGEDDHAFFGQFEKNTNIYLAARYNF
jgi:hypothetical protein